MYQGLRRRGSDSPTMSQLLFDLLIEALLRMDDHVIEMALPKSLCFQIHRLLNGG